MDTPKTTRKLSNILAAIVEELELQQPRVVSREDIAQIMRDRDLGTWTDALTFRLRKEGWLLPLRTRGVWEFAPGARAGAYGGGDPHIELRATLRRDPEFPGQLAYESAAWLQGLVQRAPVREVLSLPNRTEAPVALSGYRIVHQRPSLSTLDKDGLPVWRIESLITLIAVRPEAYHDWPNTMQWLASAAAKIDASMIRDELKGRPVSVRVRTAYLLDRGGNRSQARALVGDIGAGAGPIFLGPRTKDARFDKRYNLYDSLLRE